MLISDGVGGYGGTDWFAHDVDSMWDAIADQHTDPHNEVVRGWRRTAELTSEHLSRVTEYRANLAAAWPPDKSPASKAYLARLDELIDHLRETHAAASANYTAFSSVTSALTSTRTRLEPIYQQYAANKTSIAMWQAQKDAAAAASKPSSSPTPSPSPSPQASPVPTNPPVSAEQQEQLNNQARVLMYELSNAVISGQAELQKPTEYLPYTVERHPGGDPGKGGEDSGASVPPLIPVPAPPHTTTATISHPAGPATHPAVTPTVPAHPTGPATSLGGGLILTGAQPMPTATPPPIAPGPPSGTPVPLGPGQATFPGLPSPGLVPPPAGLIAPEPPIALTPTRGGAGLGGPLRPNPGIQPPRIGTMPSGGVIGSTPGSGFIGQIPNGSTGAGQLRAGGTSRVNPVGGVINPQSNTAGRTGQATRLGISRPGTVGHGEPMLSQSARRQRREGGESLAHWDPDNPWATDEGVDPVVVPAEEPGPIDPGPVIGRGR
ncbi:hypothetical protein [Krasilnikovia sp. MM14-A1004]|uniref:hypothetical protein n=1 Tax=Krasilnikovia sp. MM14-A1004 TaxID=3373541 RepID=UPI00399D426F